MVLDTMFLFQALSTASMPDSILYHAIHLLDLSLCMPQPDTSRKVK